MHHRPSIEHKPVANFAGVMKAVLLDVGLEIGRPANGATLWAAIRGFVSMDSLMSTVTALVGQQHLAHLTSLKEEKETPQLAIPAALFTPFSCFFPLRELLPTELLT